MTDRELLEKAAKAAGLEVIGWHRMYEPSPDSVEMAVCKDRGGEEFWWNPLIDDGHNFRLAVKLGMSIDTALGQTVAIALEGKDCLELHNDDQCAATRRAIVRAAAALAP